MIDLSDMFDKYAKLTSEIEAFKFRYKDYKLVYFDEPPLRSPTEIHKSKRKLWYLMGDTLQKEKSSLLRYDNFEILLSLLKLAKIIESTHGKGISYKEESQLACSEEIIEWCKKFGMPAYSEYFLQNYSIGKEIPPGGYRAFVLADFKRQILMLLDKFNLWYGLTYNDIKLIAKHDFFIKPQNNKYSKKDMKFLKESLTYIPTGSLRIFYNPNKDTFELIPYASDIIEVAYFQLAMLMSNKNDEKIRYCSKCGEPFLYYDGNTKYCDYCKGDLNKEYVRNYRKRQRDEILILYREGIPIEKLAKDYKKTVTQIEKWVKEG